MPIPGPAPRDPAARRRANSPTVNWTEVPKVPFAGGPKLPARRPAWPSATRRWWSAVSSMPHAVLWCDSDWQFALDTARIVAAFHAGSYRLAAEVRLREAIMGTTVDARRNLRIRYVDPPVEDEGGAASPNVTAMAQYRASVEA
jgi:hypothetical protein